jgi:hypothetical protein
LRVRGGIEKSEVYVDGDDVDWGKTTAKVDVDGTLELEKDDDGRGQVEAPAYEAKTRERSVS